MVKVAHFDDVFRQLIYLLVKVPELIKSWQVKVFSDLGTIGFDHNLLSWQLLRYHGRQLRFLKLSHMTALAIVFGRRGKTKLCNLLCYISFHSGSLISA